MEPWLSQTIDSMTEERQLDSRVNIIFKDAAGSSRKQLQDIDQLMECGVDLLLTAACQKTEQQPQSQRQEPFFHKCFSLRLNAFSFQTQ